jgi:poly(3-hydroxybutyrate) depolymerase
MKNLMRSNLPVLASSLILLFAIFSACKKNTVSRIPGGSNIQIVYNVKYGSNKDWQGNTQDLLLDVYMPSTQDPGQKFPVVLFVHGGGFIDGDKSASANMMKSFATSSYVGITINYRLGWTHTTVCDGDTTECKEAVYRAIQDTRAALRFVVAHAQEYHIDTNYVFLSGGSAGAVTVLNSYFMTQQEMNAIIPGVESKLGSINTADNNLTNSFTIKAIGSAAGCLGSADYINSSNAIPVIFFHGEKDVIIPYDTGSIYDCTNLLAVDGSLSLYNKLIQLGASAVIHLDPNGTHSAFSDAFKFDNQLCFFNSVTSKAPESGYFEGESSSCP